MISDKTYILNQLLKYYKIQLNFCTAGLENQNYIPTKKISNKTAKTSQIFIDFAMASI